VNPIYIHILPVAISFISTLLFLFFCYEFSISIGLYDKPNWRKKHIGKVPLIGGIAIIFGFLFGCLVSPRALSEWKPLFLSMMPLAVIGVMDDHGDISVKKRMVTQVLTCLIMIYYGNIYLNNFGDLLGLGFNITFIGLETLVTIFCVVGVINALNLIDGIDGLCGNLCLITCFSIIFIVLIQKNTASIALIIYFSSALIAFLIVNLGLTKRIINKVFLGDAGTTAIGFFLSWHLIKLSNGSEAVFRPIFAIWILAVPIMDTLGVIFRRLIRKKSPFESGRDHIHHLLILLGFSSKMALLVITMLSMIFALLGIASEYYNIPESYSFYTILIIFIAYAYLTNYLFRRVEND